MTELHCCVSNWTVHLFQEGESKTLCRLACAGYLVLSDDTNATCGKCVDEAGALVRRQEVSV